MLIQKVGKAEKTELVNSSLLAWFRKVELATNLLSHLLTKGEKLKGPKWLEGGE